MCTKDVIGTISPSSQDFYAVLQFSCTDLIKVEDSVIQQPHIDNTPAHSLAQIFRELYVVVRPSVRRRSVMFVHPTQASEIFGNVSMPFGTLAVFDLSVKFYGDHRGVKPKRGSHI